MTTGFIDINGSDLSVLYYDSSFVSSDTVSDALTFTNVNTFYGTIIHNLVLIPPSTAASYDYTNVPNFVQAKGGNQAVSFTLPTMNVPDGYILYFRRNNGIASVTYNFSPNIFNASNTSVSSISTSGYSFSLLKYNTAWYIHHRPI